MWTSEAALLCSSATVLLAVCLLPCPADSQALGASQPGQAIPMEQAILGSWSKRSSDDKQSLASADKPGQAIPMVQAILESWSKRSSDDKQSPASADKSQFSSPNPSTPQVYTVRAARHASVPRNRSSLQGKCRTLQVGRCKNIYLNENLMLVCRVRNTPTGEPRCRVRPSPLNNE